MKILVTGHRGYIGVEMIPALRAAGHEVAGLDTDYFDACDFAAPPDEVPSARLDLRDVTAEHCRGFDAVIHLAALSNDALGNLDPKLTYDINLHGSVRLARAAKEAGVRRFLFSSSCSLYGGGSDGYVDEGAGLDPLTPYGESKIAFEREASALADRDFSPVYLRNATAYGVSRRLRADVVVNNLVGHAVTRGQVLLESDGTPWRPLVHIDDIIHAFLCCLHAPVETIHDQAFNVGRSGENFRIREVAEVVAAVVPKATVAFKPGAVADARNYRVDFKKIETALPGYAPRWTLRRGAEELYDAYVRHGLSRDQWDGPRYYRLRTIQRLQGSGILGADLRRV